MTESKTIKFDEIKYLVTKDNQSVTLNPLSFKLLFTLAQTPELVVSNKTLMTSVWPNNVISPDTLKQRVFVLRKSLEQSTIKGLSIQTVRGQGYRLLIEQLVMPIDQTFVPKPTPNLHTVKVPQFNKKVFGITFVALLMTIIILTFTQSTNNDKATSNNRIALWSNIPLNEMSENALNIYQTWNDLLSQANEEQRLQLILSNQRKELVLPLQARKDRLALISYFEIIEVNNDTIIKLSIVEPTTATILRTSSFSMLSTSSLLQALQSQLNGIESLLSSGKLYLNKQQREYAKDPIWPVLKALANPA